MQIILVHTADTPIISVRETIAIQNFPVLIDKAFGRVMKAGAKCVGMPLTVYHSPVFDPDKADLEVGFPVRPQDNYTRVLKGHFCASGLHRGDYSRLHETYEQIGGWVRNEGYTVCAPLFEVYLNDARKLPAGELLTQVYFPIEEQPF